MSSPQEPWIGRPLEREFVAPRPGDVRHSQASSERFREVFPAAERVDLEVGLRETISWMDDFVAATDGSSAP